MPPTHPEWTCSLEVPFLTLFEPWFFKSAGCCGQTMSKVAPLGKGSEKRAAWNLVAPHRSTETNASIEHQLLKYDAPFTSMIVPVENSEPSEARKRTA